MLRPVEDENRFEESIITAKTYLPCHETNCFDDSRLDDLFPGEDTPCHSVRSVRVGVGSEVSFAVDDVVSDVAVLVDV